MYGFCLVRSISWRAIAIPWNSCSFILRDMCHCDMLVVLHHCYSFLISEAVTCWSLQVMVLPYLAETGKILLPASSPRLRGHLLPPQSHTLAPGQARCLTSIPNNIPCTVLSLQWLLDNLWVYGLCLQLDWEAWGVAFISFFFKPRAS